VSRSRDQLEGQRARERRRRHKALAPCEAVRGESAVLLIWLVLFGYLTFAGTGWRSSPVLLYLLVPPLLWAGLRLGLKGVSTSMLIVTFMAVWGAA
jgi:integral membrane sensor domain MASE1